MSKELLLINSNNLDIKAEYLDITTEYLAVLPSGQNIFSFPSFFFRNP